MFRGPSSGRWSGDHQVVLSGHSFTKPGSFAVAAGERGHEPVRDHGCDGTRAGAGKTMLRGSPGSRFTSRSSRFRSSAAPRRRPGGVLSLPVPPALL